MNAPKPYKQAEFVSILLDSIPNEAKANGQKGEPKIGYKSAIGGE